MTPARATLADLLFAVALGLAMFLVLGFAVCPSCMTLNPL